jgi:hypothetical protein
MLAYDANAHTLTLQVSASGLTPGLHAAHIHDGSCQAQGAVAYMLPDLMAHSDGTISQMATLTGVMSPPPATGWYLNIHTGTGNTILSGGKPTLAFQPLLCGDITGGVTSGGGSAHGQIVTSGGEQFYSAQLPLAQGQQPVEQPLLTVGPFKFTVDCTTVLGADGKTPYNQVAFNVTSSAANSDLDGQGAVPAGTLVNIHTDSDLKPNPQGATPPTPNLANGTLSQTPSASTSTELAVDGTEVDLFYNDGVNYGNHACFAGAVAFVS